MATIHHQLWIQAPAADVYDAIATAEGLSRWWGPHKSSDEDGAPVVSHNPGPEHGEVRLKVLDRIRDRRVEWECISTHPKSSPASVWTGTHFIWDISQRKNIASQSGVEKDGDDQVTLLDFRQTGYDEHSEFFERNNSAWAGVLENLKQVCESASAPTL
jgi:uncharacterized protein YndB with AHSA1/START domain